MLLGIRFSLCGMPKDAGILLVTLTILDEESADGHCIGNISVHVATLVAFLARTSIPMYADFGLELRLISLLEKSSRVLLNFIDCDVLFTLLIGLWLLLLLVVVVVAVVHHSCPIIGSILISILV